MTTPRAARRARASERGVTLIELLVTIAVLAVGFVALLSAFSADWLAVGTTSDDARQPPVPDESPRISKSEAFATFSARDRPAPPQVERSRTHRRFATPA